MTTTWKIYNLERNIESGLVINVTYGCVVKTSNHITRKVGGLVLEGDPSLEDFIPFEDLTEEIVIGWVKNELGTQAVSDLETQLEDQIQEMIDVETSKTTEEGLPWGDDLEV